MWKIVKSDQMLYTKTESKPIRNDMPVTIRQLGIRFQWNRSSTMETTVSIKEMEDVIAASTTNKKNTAPTICPPNISLKTFGSVINIRLGPAFKAFSSPPEKTNTAGTIISPDRKATKVSNTSIWRTELSMLSSFRM